MDSLTCPVCSEALSLTENRKSLRCQHNHLFDIAKQGYLNLLLSHKKKSKQPGDTPEMVSARTSFLNQDYYADFLEHLLKLISDDLPGSLDPVRYCDIACGEGYYTHHLHQFLSERHPSITTGLDISTPAIKAATRRNKAIQWLIASANQIPLRASSQDLLTCLFCRVDYVAASKIAKQGALFVIAETGPNHLIELREKLYDEIHQPQQTEPQSSGEFEAIKTESFTQKIQLNSAQDIQNLLAMTPHFWRVKPDRKKTLETLSTMSLTLDIHLHLFRKVSPS